MSEPFIALVGAGTWGRNHLRVLRELGVLRWAFDSDAGVAESNIPREIRAESLETILTDKGVRGVVVATPARSHHALTREILQSGRDVLVEKPLTLDEEHGEELVRIAQERGQLLMVGHITLYHPAIQHLKTMLREGGLGRVRYVHSSRLNLGTVREEEDILWSFAPHDVAVLLNLLGTWPAEVSAVGGSYLRKGRADVTVTHLKFPDDVRAHIFVSWLHPFKEHRLVVIGERRMAVFSDSPQGGELRVYDQPLHGLENGPPPTRGAGTVIELPNREPLRSEAEHFIECMKNRAEPLSGGDHGLKVLRILETARRSLSAGGTPLECAPVGAAQS